MTFLTLAKTAPFLQTFPFLTDTTTTTTADRKNYMAYQSYIRAKGNPLPAAARPKKGLLHNRIS